MENGGQEVVRKVKRKAFLLLLEQVTEKWTFFRAGVCCFGFIFSIYTHFRPFKSLKEMQTKIGLYRFCFVTETLGFLNIVFPGQYLKEFLNILVCRHTLPLYMHIFVILEKDVVIFNVLTDSREIKN